MGAMIASAMGVVLSSLVAVGLLLLAPEPPGFDGDSCARLQNKLDKEVFGQQAAALQFSSAVCDHLWDQEPLKPLVLSIHGPPGVGKSYSHFVAARALYNATSKAETNLLFDYKNKNKVKPPECPGLNCPGYKVVYGLDYTLAEGEAQSQALINRLTEHLTRYKESVVVIEEYDKLDCRSRGVLKQIFDKGEAANATESLKRSVFLLESNAGYGKIAEALVEAGGRQDLVDLEALQYTLKNMMFALWQRDGCEDRVDTVKALSLIDMFVPYFPLSRETVSRIMSSAIERRVAALNAERVDRGFEGRVGVRVEQRALEFLNDRIEWDGSYAVEGAKEVSTVIRRHVFGLLYGLAGEEEKEGEYELDLDEGSGKVVLRKKG